MAQKYEVNKLELNFYENTMRDEQLFDNKKVYFIRKNVAVGVRVLSMLDREEIGDETKRLCEAYAKGEENSLCKGLNDLVDKLNWHSNDLASESCENQAVKTVWIPDVHDGPRVDLSSTLVHLGQNAIVSGDKRDRSPYPEALKLSKIVFELSNHVASGRCNSHFGIGESSIQENFEFYKENPDFSNVDAVICGFPMSMCKHKLYLLSYHK